MMYEFKVVELAEEFGVHRNTIRNWITTGTLPAKEGPGKRYMMDIAEYVKLCDKFGRVPKLNVDMAVQVEELKTLEKRENGAEPIDIVNRKSEEIYTDPAFADLCLTCGTCASACPIAGVDDLDPRKIVRMAAFGLKDELVDTNWIWKCTMCAKCENACPMNIEIVKLIRSLRAKRERDLVPGSIHKGVAVCLERGNNLGIPKDDFLFLMEDLAEEMRDEGLTDFTVPIDKRGARVLVTINSKEPFAEPDDMKFWWRIFHAAGENWTVASEHWEGVNWGLFSGDDEAQKTVVGRIVDNMERLGCEALLLPE
jgi:heterodisulfide reductase subunit C